MGKIWVGLDPATLRNEKIYTESDLDLIEILWDVFKLAVSAKKPLSISQVEVISVASFLQTQYGYLPIEIKLFRVIGLRTFPLLRAESQFTFYSENWVIKLSTFSSAAIDCDMRRYMLALYRLAASSRDTVDRTVVGVKQTESKQDMHDRNAPPLRQSKIAQIGHLL